MKFSLSLLCLLSIFLSACSSTDQYSTRGLEAQLYQRAQKNIALGAYNDAIEQLQAMEKQYPFGEYSKAAQLALIYAYYQFDEPESAKATANRFIRLHPKHRHVDYAYYMRGLISFPVANSLLQKFLGTDLSQRDISAAETSFHHFSTLTKQFPNSEYTPDAKQRMVYLRHLLARHEINIANYYLSRNAYLAAANRGRFVVENFQQTAAVPDALAVMVYAYHHMQMPILSQDALSVLQNNYPNHPALDKQGQFNYQHGEKANHSWLSRLTFGVLGNPQPPGFYSEALYNPPNSHKEITPAFRR